MPDRRITINASILGSDSSGLGTYTANVVTGIARLRGAVDVYAPGPDRLGLGAARFRRALPMLLPNRSAAGHVIRLLWLQTILRARLLVDRPEVVLNTVPEGLLAPVAPQVTVVHDIIPLLYPGDYPRQQLYFRRLVPAVLRASRTVIADSENTRRDIIEAYQLRPDNVRVVPPGYDERTFFPNWPARQDGAAEPYILYVGNLLPHKNLLGLLDAFVVVRRRLGARLLIRGDGKPRYLRKIRERVEELGLTSCVQFLPYATPTELRQLYCGARVLALPSRYEGFGLAPLEAMACGTPVVAGNTASVPEVVGDAAILVDPDNTWELAEALCRVLTDSELGEALRARGLKQAARFSWGRTAEEILRILDE